MKTRNILTLAIAATTLAACGQPIEDSADAPLDAEHGLETMDGKDDSFAIRPGSPEAEAVLKYVNRDIANDAEGVAFRDDMDVKLHAWAARNIADFRAGDDATFGTADDKRFDNLALLDGVPYVGRSALMQLFGLAEAAGLFQRPTVDCADYVAHDRWNNYYIRSYADLLEVENARCSTVNGNVYLQIQGTDLLPPQARAIRNLRHLKTINGDLQITTSNHWTSLHFEGLETVTGQVVANSAAREHTIEFAALKSAKSINLTLIGSSLFPVLEHNDDIRLVDSDLEGFTGLKTAGSLYVHERFDGTYNVAFPKLTEVSSLNVDVYRRSAWTEPDVSFTGSFAKLATAGALVLSNGKYGALKFPDLVEVQGLSTSLTRDAYVGMTDLAKVGSLTSTNDKSTSGIHSGPAALETVGTMRVVTELAVDGYDVLETATGNIEITSNGGLEGFDALTTADGAINLALGRNRAAMKLNGFNALGDAGSVAIDAGGAVTEIGALFESLEFAGGLALTSNAGFDENPVFESLAGIEGNLRVDVLRDGLDMMPELQLVDGAVVINGTPADLAGFPKLERIEGSLSLRANVTEISGWQSLTAIGGNLSVPRTLPQPELDEFLLRLDEFSGTITYN